MVALGKSMAGIARGIIVEGLILCVRAYQFAIRPHLFGACAFHPTCSEYAIEALQKKGPIRGLRLAVGRLLRCRPMTSGGYDPVED